jgi:Helix-turn-helix domain
MMMLVMRESRQGTFDPKSQHWAALHKGDPPVKMNWVQFGRELKRVREISNLSLREAAKQSGVHYASWSRTERGEYQKITALHYLSLCRWMGADPFKYFKP